MTITIAAWDPDTAPEADFPPLYELAKAQWTERAPEEPHTAFERWRKAFSQKVDWEKTSWWRALDSATGRVVGSSYLNIEYLETNRHIADFAVDVAADARRQGVGTRLLEPVLAGAAVEHRTTLFTNAVQDSPAHHFLTAMGAEARSIERKSRVDLAAIDRPMLEGWVERAQERAGEYRVLAWEGPVPDEYLERFVKVVEVMNTAPRDGLEFEDWVETPERFRENEKHQVERGNSWFVVVAEHTPTGHFAGFSTIGLWPDSEEVVGQYGTGVDPAHRNKGLGRWLKAVNCIRLLDERPQTRYVDTWNAFSNDAMLGINIAMGFELLRAYADFQGSTAEMQQAVKARLA